MMDDGNQAFELGDTRVVEYALTSYHQLGAQPDGQGGLRFRYWAPNARRVVLEVDAERGTQMFPLRRKKNGL